jgi:hypothetical protein
MKHRVSHLKADKIVLGQWKKFYDIGALMSTVPITVAAWSKTRIVFPPSKAGIVGSNPTQGIDVCMRLFCDCVDLCVGSGLSTG